MLETTKVSEASIGQALISIGFPDQELDARDRDNATLTTPGKLASVAL